MPQQVWVFLSATDQAWGVRDLARRLDMPLATVRGQVRRLEQDGRITRLPGRYSNRVLYRRAD